MPNEVFGLPLGNFLFLILIVAVVISPTLERWFNRLPKRTMFVGEAGLTVVWFWIIVYFAGPGQNVRLATALALGLLVFLITMIVLWIYIVIKWITGGVKKIA